MNAFYQQIGCITDAPGGVSRVRALALDLAVRGQLVAQDAADEPATMLLERLEQTARTKQAYRDRHPIQEWEIPYTVPSNWKWARFAQVAHIASALVSPLDFLDLPHIAPNNIEKGTGRLLDYGTVREDEVKSGNHRFFAGQILYSKIRPNLAKAVLIDFDGLCSADMYPIDCFLHAPYLLLYMLSGPFLRMAVRRDTRVAMPKINQAELNQLLVPVPPITEQERIATKLKAIMATCDDLECRQERRRELRLHLNGAALDRLITASDPAEFAAAWQRVRDNFDLLYAVPENVGKLRQAILQLAVQGKLVPQDLNDAPASDLVMQVRAIDNGRASSGRRLALASIRPGEVDAVPSDRWTWARLGELAEIVSGVTKGRDLNGRATQCFPYLRVANVQAGFLDLSEMKEIEIPNKELSKYRLQRGDIILTEGGDWDKLGRSAIWEDQIENCIHQNHVFRARLLTQAIRPQWISLFTNSPVGRQYFQNAAKQTTNLASINMTQLRNCPIPLPPTAEQDRILARVDQMLSLCDELETKLKQQRDHGDRLAQAIVNAVLNGKAPVGTASRMPAADDALV